MAGHKRLSVGIAGLGAIGWEVAAFLSRTPADLCLRAVSTRNRARAEQRLRAAGSNAIVTDNAELAEHCDVVVEALPPAEFLTVAEAAIAKGRIFVPLTVTALVKHADLVDRAAREGARIIIPSGAIVGLDGIRAAAQGRIDHVILATRKPPAAFRNVSWLAEAGINVAALDGPRCLFDGSVREAAQLFAANVNVAVLVALAGIGLDATRYQIWADPAIDHNQHALEVEADSTFFTVTIDNKPSAENPATSRLAAQSVMTTLMRLSSPLVVGA